MAEPRAFLGALETEETPMGHRTFGYKHWFIDAKKLEDPKQAETLFIVIHRNPYTWVRAMMDRPYALEKSIGGKPLKDLTKIKLVGHMKGRDTANEFDPETGGKLTLFELRKRKIESFETIKASAENVVYVNLEALVSDPDLVITQLAAQFPSAFKPTLTFERRPYKQLKAEFERPEMFEARDKTVLDKALDWRWERVIGYGKDSYRGGWESLSEITILHGGSSSGKSYTMNKIAEIDHAFQTLEMDDCKYWDQASPALSLEGLKLLLPDAKSSDLKALKGLFNDRSSKKSRCVNFLLSQLGSLLGAGASAHPPAKIIATCGALPIPGAPASETIYTWLEARLPIIFRHVLLDIPADRHQKQMEARKRAHLKSDIGTLHSQMVAKRHLFDCAVPDLSGVAAFLGITVSQPGPARIKPAQSGAPVRIKRPDLTHIQIFGERSSGTKYLTSLIAENMKDPGNVLGSYASKKDPVNKAKRIGYKHYYPNPTKIAQHQRETLFLVVHKNPYTWIRSMLGKPYHFKACLEGKSVTDLPELKLAGYDIHGREIPDVHPVSGARLTMFELRKHKILEWERLANYVDHIAYVNYEHLLMQPSEIVQAITDAFPSLFASPRAPDHVPDPHYVSKYVTPKPFSGAEMEVMDTHIDWEAEAILGYKRGNLFI